MKKFGRFPAVLVIVAMLFGFVPEVARAQTQAQSQTAAASYNPYQQGFGANQDPRYNRGYGQSYNPNYYQPGSNGYSGGYGFTKLVPPLVGAVLGLAMGAKFGLVGAAIGGAIGFFGGKAISSAFFGDNYYQGNEYYFQASNKANFIPGAIGAMLGTFMGMSFGPIGMIVGGGIGYLVAKGIAKAMFPNLYYGGNYSTIPGGGGYGGGYGGYYPRSPEPSASVESAAAPSAPGSADLGVLKAAVATAMKAYQEAMTGNDEASIRSTRLDYLGAQKAFLQAKQDAY